VAIVWSLNGLDEVGLTMTKGNAIDRFEERQKQTQSPGSGAR